MIYAWNEAQPTVPRVNNYLPVKALTLEGLTDTAAI